MLVLPFGGAYNHMNKKSLVGNDSLTCDGCILLGPGGGLFQDKMEPESLVVWLASNMQSYDSEAAIRSVPVPFRGGGTGPQELHAGGECTTQAAVLFMALGGCHDCTSYRTA